MHYRRLNHVLLMVVLLLATSLTAFAEAKLTVYAVNYPLTYFAERIGGDHVNVVFPVPPDVDPAFWSPDAKTVRKYQQADLIILNGADYEKWTKKVSLPMLRSVDTSRVFKKNLLLMETTVTPTHGPAGAHPQGDTP